MRLFYFDQVCEEVQYGEYKWQSLETKTFAFGRLVKSPFWLRVLNRYIKWRDKLLRDYYGRHARRAKRKYWGMTAPIDEVWR